MSITTNCQVIEVARVRRDAGVLFGELPFERWNEEYLTGLRETPTSFEKFSLGRDKCIALSANVLTIRTESDHILVDTGTPSVHEDLAPPDWSSSKLRNQLKTIGMTLKEITKIVITSFDIDHAGGLTRIDGSGELAYTFPRAEVFYHANTEQRQRPRTIANANAAARMLVNNKHHPCWEETEISPGIMLYPIFGPSLQSSVVVVTRGADRFMYLGDLCPTVYHVNGTVIPASDHNPEATYEERRHWLEKAKSGGYKVVFGHGTKTKTAWIEEHKGGLVVRPV